MLLKEKSCAGLLKGGFNQVNNWNDIINCLWIYSVLYEQSLKGKFCGQRKPHRYEHKGSTSKIYRVGTGFKYSLIFRDFCFHDN